MTSPSSSNSNSGNSFTDLLNQTILGNTETKPKINSQGQIDIYGIGQNSGVEFPLGTSSYTGDNGDVNGPGGHVTFDRQTAPRTEVDTTSTDNYLQTIIKLSQTNPSAYIALQQGLYQSGFYGNVPAADVGFGRWNARTKAALTGSDGALTNFLEVYKSGATADTFNEWLGKQAALAAQDPNSPGNGSGGLAYRFPYSDPALVAQYGDQQSEQLLGHSLDQGDQSALYQDIHQNEVDQFNAMQSGQPHTAKDPAAQARLFVVNNNLPEYAAHQAEGYLNAFANMFLGGQSARPNTTIGDVAVANQPQ